MSRREYEHRPGEEYTVTLRPFTVHVKPVSTFSFFLRFATGKRIGNGDSEIPLGEMRVTYGAGPCIAGLAILRDMPHLFHYDSAQILEPLPLLTRAGSGIVSGDSKSIAIAHRYQGLGRFTMLDEGITSLLARHLPDNRIELYHMLS